MSIKAEIFANKIESEIFNFFLLVLVTFDTTRMSFITDFNFNTIPTILS